MWSFWNAKSWQLLSDSKLVETSFRNGDNAIDISDGRIIYQSMIICCKNEVAFPLRRTLDTYVANLPWLYELDLGQYLPLSMEDSELLHIARMRGDKSFDIPNEYHPLTYCHHYDLINFTQTDLLGKVRYVIPAPVTDIEYESDYSTAPDAFKCSITQVVMQNPVTIEDGHSYERSAIEEWFTGGKITSPITNLPLTSARMHSNLALKCQIETWKAEQIK